MKDPSFPYIAPFLAFLFFLAMEGKWGVGPEIEYPARVILLSVLIWAVSRHVIDWKVRHAAGSILLGIAVFVIWVAPDYLIPGYRQHWLFNNSIVGTANTTPPPYASMSMVALVARTVRATLVVPVIEELFWRSWLLRWLIDPKFEAIRIGTYQAKAFWIVVVLFALEHGSYWEVGALAGIAYNWWMIRTRSLGDCMLAHAVTNGILSAYVLRTGQWQYW